MLIVYASTNGREADAEDALETETAEANIFVREVAVLRVKVESHNTWGDDDDGCMDGGQKEDVVSISRVDEEHLKEILEQVPTARCFEGGREGVCAGRHK